MRLIQYFQPPDLGDNKFLLSWSTWVCSHYLQQLRSWTNLVSAFTDFKHLWFLFFWDLLIASWSREQRDRHSSRGSVVGPGRQGVKGGKDGRKQPLGFSVGGQSVIKKIDLGVETWLSLWRAWCKQDDLSSDLLNSHKKVRSVYLKS